MQSHTIPGGGGTRLHVVETGNLKGRPILYIHGFSQCWLAWSRQLNSDLARDYRLVAMTLSRAEGEAVRAMLAGERPDLAALGLSKREQDELRAKLGSHGAR